MITVDETSIVLAALRHLAAACDGAHDRDDVGFSKPDIWRGKQLAGQSTLTPEDVDEAYKLLHKYEHTQLAPAGLTLPDARRVRTAAVEKINTSGTIDLHAPGWLRVKFPKYMPFVARIKTLKKRYFNPEGLFWEVDIAEYADLLALFPKFKITEKAEAAIAEFEPPKYIGTMTLHQKRFIKIVFEYDKALVDAVKALKGRKWHGKIDGPEEDKYWTVPLAEFDAAKAALPRFQVDPAIQVEVTRLKAEAAEVAEREQALDRAVAGRLQSVLDAELPGGRKLFKHQQEGVSFLLKRRRAILADDMGLGKSLQALVAARALNLPALVVCPASLILNWEREAVMAMTTVAPHSWAKVPEPPDFDFVLIADEAHYMQSIDSKRSRAALALADSPHCMGVFLLTGTPLKNGRPVNLFPLLKAVRHELAEDRSKYEVYYCDGHATRWTRWDVSGAKHLDELHANTRNVMLRRMKRDCLDLPDKTRVIRGVELSAKAVKLYDERFDQLREEYRQRRKERLAEKLGTTVDKVDETAWLDPAEALVMLGHLQQAGSIAKTETALEIAEQVIEEGNQVVLFTRFVESGHTLADALGTRLFEGSLNKQDRQVLIDRFQAGQDKAFVSTLQAGGVGITLTAAQTVVLVDRGWTPADVAQAEDRLHRIGQKNAVTAIWLQYGKADEELDALLVEKQERIDLVLQGKRKTLRGAGGSPEQIAQALLPEIFG